MGQGTDHYILVTFRIPVGLWPRIKALIVKPPTMLYNLVFLLPSAYILTLADVCVLQGRF